MTREERERRYEAAMAEHRAAVARHKEWAARRRAALASVRLTDEESEAMAEAFRRLDEVAWAVAREHWLAARRALIGPAWDDQIDPIKKAAGLSEVGRICGALRALEGAWARGESTRDAVARVHEALRAAALAGQKKR